MTTSLESVYRRRFNDEEAAKKDAIWREIAAYLQRYVPSNAAVLDIACDHGDFIRNITASEKWATDIRDVSRHLPSDVRFACADGLELSGVLPTEYFDVVFMSNYLEHLPSSTVVIEQLRVSNALLKEGGRVIVLQPNVRLVGGAYWDFIDHHVALTEKSLAEAASLAGFRKQTLITRFLPYTTKSRYPMAPALVRAYLRFRPAWLLLGQQTLYVGAKAPELRETDGVVPDTSILLARDRRGFSTWQPVALTRRVDVCAMVRVLLGIGHPQRECASAHRRRVCRQHS